MSESPSVPASFLNLDLELEAAVDLAPLAESFGSQVFVLYCGEAGDAFRLSVEPVIEGKLSGDPLACTEYFLDLVDGLSKNERNLWKLCTSRRFDYGFDGGLEENPLQTNIGLAHLTRMAKLNIEIRVTVYPYRAHEGDDV
jgi:hypothetical protein